MFILNFIFLGTHCNNTFAELSTRTYWYCKMPSPVKYRNVRI